MASSPTSTFDFSKVASIASQVVEPGQYKPVGPFSERHGSWELTFHRHDQNLERFVVVALTDLEVGCAVEILAGAEDAVRHSVKRIASEFQIPLEDLLREQGQELLRKSLENGMSLANKIADYELTDAFALQPKRGERMPA